jgi:hypothetical protein
MKKTFYIVIAACFLFMIAIGACDKPKPNVSSLTIETSPATGSNLAPAPGPDFPLVVTVTSTMPSGGVKIDVTARAEGSTIPFFNTSTNTSNKVSNFVITGAPQGVTSVVDVTVTSLSDASVKATSTYRFAKK